jgi:hypothetical protein
MQMRTDPRSPIMRGVYLISPTDVDMKHARKRAAHVDPAALPHPNRRLRRKLARRMPAHPDNRVRLEVDELLGDHRATSTSPVMPSSSGPVVTSNASVRSSSQAIATDR